MLYSQFLGVYSIETAALPYANKNIYLFLGGFLIALSIERSGLHKRLALIMIKSVGSNGPKLIGGFMLVSALISMWVMNTSTTLMLLPIGLAICSVVAKTVPNMTEKDKSNFDKALLLSIAYAAMIGGMSTLVGTAPNIVFSSFHAGSLWFRNFNDRLDETRCSCINLHANSSLGKF